MRRRYDGAGGRAPGARVRCRAEPVAGRILTPTTGFPCLSPKTKNTCPIKRMAAPKPRLAKCAVSVGHPRKRAHEVSPVRPIRKPSLKAKDYLLEAAEAAESAAEPAAEAAEAAVSAEAAAVEAAESADEAAESVEAASPPLQADRLRAAPATAAARMILRMNGIP